MKTALRITALLLGLSMLMPAVSFAQTATSTDAITQLKQRILNLQAQILELQKQQQQVTLELLKTLQQGATGNDVKTLQQLLAGDSEIYPEGKITGFFGPLTAKAVKKFQKKHGLEQVGFVGPKTLKKINEVLRETGMMMTMDDLRNFASSTASTTAPCAFVPPGHYIAPGWLKKMNGEREGHENENSGDNNEHGEHGDRGNKYGLNLPCGQGTTTPPVIDTTAPVISNVAVGSITQTGASITWITNEATVAKTAYGTSTTYTIETGFSSAFSSAFTQVLSGLTASTTYHFRITAKDAAGNIASTGDVVFTTSSVPPPADTTAPIISGISVGSIASTTATIMWTTNELANSKVYYGTTTPLSLSGASFISDSSLVTSHTKSLSGLTASTTHYYVIESKDGAGNTATSTESSFTTLP